MEIGEREVGFVNRSRVSKDGDEKRNFDAKGRRG